jgi:hypothetical protein
MCGDSAHKRTSLLCTGGDVAFLAKNLSLIVPSWVRSLIICPGLLIPPQVLSSMLNGIAAWSEDKAFVVSCPTSALSSSR